MDSTSRRMLVRQLIRKDEDMVAIPEQFQYIDVSAVSSDSLEIEKPTLHQRATAPSRAQKPVRSGDTIFATIRPALKRIALVPQLLDGAVASTAFAVLRPDPSLIDPDFLFLSVSADSFVTAVSALQSGASYPAVRDRDVWGQEIWVPALNTQRDIASTLMMIREAIRLERMAEATAGQLKATAMRELFTRGLWGEAQRESSLGPIPESWRVERLERVARLATGTTPSTAHTDYFVGTTPFFRTAEITNCRLAKSSSFVSDEAIADYSLKVFPKGTILMAMYGQGKTRGQVGLLECAAATTQNAGAIQPNQGIDSAYLWHYLLHCYERLRATGSLGHLSHLNLGYLREFEVPIPTETEQQEIAVILDAIDQKVELHKQKRLVLDALFQSLLHKLMTGEIRVSDLDLSALSVGLGEPYRAHGGHPTATV